MNPNNRARPTIKHMSAPLPVFRREVAITERRGADGACLFSGGRDRLWLILDGGSA
ncbi:hypothetical protein J6590_003560, partial [Homalodisca vitripennis]